MSVISGWALVVLFGLAAAKFANLWWINAEVLRIDRDGIRYSLLPGQLIVWNEITKVTVFQFKFTRYIVLHLRHKNSIYFNGFKLFGFTIGNKKVKNIKIELGFADRRIGETMAAINWFRAQAEDLLPP